MGVPLPSHSSTCEFGSRGFGGEPARKYLRIAVDTLTVVLSLAVFGACVYGITNSLKATNGKGAAFWSLVDQGTSKVTSPHASLPQPHCPAHFYALQKRPVLLVSYRWNPLRDLQSSVASALRAVASLTGDG